MMEIMVNSMIGHEALSFMDGLYNYNHIRMAPKYKELMAFQLQKAYIAIKSYLSSLKIRV